MEDIFKIEPEEPNKMDSKVFFEKTKMLLEKAASIYSNNWQSRPLKDEEFPDESICDKCQGCGVFKDENGEERDCVQDSRAGWCYNMFFDYEEFGKEIEPLTEEFYELLSVDEIVCVKT